MSGTYVISGPTTIGTTGQQNEILGTAKLTDLSTASSILLADASKVITPFGLSGLTAGAIIEADGSGSLQSLAPGSTGDVLTVVAGVPAWAAPVSASSLGFCATKNGNQASITTPAVITTWDTTAAPYFDNSSSAFDPLTGIFTAPAAGVYYVEATVGATNTSNAGSRVLSLELNGTTDVAKTVFQPTPNTSVPQRAVVARMLSLALNDAITVKYGNVSGAAVSTVLGTPTTEYQTSFSVTRMA